MSIVQDTGPLDWRIAIVSGDGRPTPEFQRRWATQRTNNSLIGGITFGSGTPTTVPNDGDEYVNIATTPYTLYIGKDSTWHQVGPIKFTDLSDVPNTYVGNAGKFAQVNTGATALQFGSAVTSITAGSGLSGGTITSTGTIALANTAVVAGSYTNTNITVDAQGRLTSASNGSIGVTGANPTATASDTAVNGSATTFMRSDAAPAVQKSSTSQFGLVKVDGTSITSSGGVISATGGGGGGGGSAYKGYPPAVVSSPTSAPGTDLWHGLSLIVDETCTLTSLMLVVTGISASATIQAAIYADNGMKVDGGALLASSSVITGVSLGVNTYTLTTPLNVTKGQVIWIGFINHVASVTFSAGFVANCAFINAPVGAPPNPAGASSIGAPVALWMSK